MKKIQEMSCANLRYELGMGRAARWSPTYSPYLVTMARQQHTKSIPFFHNRLPKPPPSNQTSPMTDSGVTAHFPREM